MSVSTLYVYMVLLTAGKEICFSSFVQLHSSNVLSMQFLFEIGMQFVMLIKGVGLTRHEHVCMPWFGEIFRPPTHHVLVTGTSEMDNASFVSSTCTVCTTTFPQLLVNAHLQAGLSNQARGRGFKSTPKFF